MNKSTKRQQIYDSALEILTTPSIEEPDNTDVTSIVSQLAGLSNKINETVCHLQKPSNEAKSSQKLKNEELTSQIEKATTEKEDEKIMMEKLVEEKQRLQKTRDDIDLQLEEQLSLLKELVTVTSKNQYICSLFKNITKLEWDVDTCKGSSSTKGAFKTEDGIQPFCFEAKDMNTMQDKLWNMMKEGEHFATDIADVP